MKSRLQCVVFLIALAGCGDPTSPSSRILLISECVDSLQYWVEVVLNLKASGGERKFEFDSLIQMKRAHAEFLRKDKRLDNIMRDPWGEEFRLQVVNDGARIQVKITSSGPNRVFECGGDDIWVKIAFNGGSVKTIGSVKNLSGLETRR